MRSRLRLTKKLTLFVVLMLLCFPRVGLGDTTVYQDVIDEITNMRMSSIYNIELNAPFSKDTSGIRETINPENGSIYVNYQLFDTMGKGGVNSISLSLQYSNISASIKQEGVVYNEEDDYYQNTLEDKSVFNQSLSAMGVGWKLQLPYIEKEGERNNTVLYVHMPDGSVYKRNLKKSTGLDDYWLDDVKFSEVNITSDNKTISYMLRYIDGTIYYFDNSGYLFEKHDKYSNIIRYHWSDDAIPLLNAITDNSGNSVSFEYNDETITVKHKNRKFKIIRELRDNSYFINEIEDPQGRRTKFSYAPEYIEFDFFGNDKHPADVENTYYLLNRITYNTGLTTVYTYDIVKKWLYEANKGYIEYSKVRERYDIDNGTKNYIRYLYSNEPDGYPVYKSSDLPSNYYYSTTLADEFGSKTTYKYDNMHNQIEKSTQTNGRVVVEEIRNFDRRTNMPKNFISNTYNESGNCISVQTDTSFDEKGNLISSDTYSDGEESGKNVANYKYSTGTNMCIYESYMKNNSTKVEIKRTLAPGGFAYSSEEIYENGSLIKKDTYKYNSHSNIEESRIQKGVSDYLTTRYSYDSKYGGKYPTKIVVTGVKNADGEIDSYTYNYEYDDYGNCIKQTDSNLNVTQFKYDNINRKLVEILEDGTSRTYSYDDKQNIITEINANGLKLLYFYDKCGKLKSVYDSNAGVTLLKCEYDNKERPIVETDANGTQYKYSYDALDRYVSVTVNDKSGNIISEKYLSYDEAYKSIDGNYLKLSLREGSAVNERKTEYFFDYKNQLIQKTLKSELGDRIYRYEYDLSGNMIAETSPSLNTTHIDYDVFGNPVRIIYPDNTEEYFEYDFDGNCTSATDANGEKTFFYYDSLSRKTKEEIPNENGYSVFKTYYDYRNNIIKETDANANEILYTYNERGFLDTVNQYSNANEGIQSFYEYDNEGNMTKMSYGAIGSDERRTTSYSLDLYGNVLKETDNLGNSNLYEYDFLGNVTKSTDRNGVTTEYFYDGLSRVTEQKNSKSGILKTSYNEFGEISEKSDGTLYTKYEYNKFGDVEKIIKNSTSELYEYDIDANVTKHILDDKDMGKTEYLYKYNDKNLPIEIITPIGTEYITYDKAGRITQKENSQTGTQKKYSYFPNGNIKDILTSQSGETVYFENYSYDKNGNKVYENLNGVVSQYSYDGMSRLKRAIKNNIVTEYEFDGFNNISKEFEIADNKISKKQYFYDLNNRLILSEDQNNVIQYQYDNAGNMTKKTYFTGGKATDSYYRYDGYNRLSEFESNNTYSQYAYNPDGLRESKTVNGVKTRFMYNGADVAGELTDGNYYLYHRATELMGYTSFKGDTYYYRQDSHGNVTAILDITGNEIKSYSYNPYGKKETFSINPEGNNTILYQWKAEVDKFHNPFGYCGEYTDNETGLIYLRNRYYDTNNGRFITEDPIKDGLNWYVYCGNNPIMFVDGFGLASVAIRDYVGQYDGTVSWYRDIGRAYFSLNGNELWVSGSGENKAGIEVNNIDDRLYADDSDLNKFFFGITSTDTEAGVTITMFEGKPYIDITTPVVNALNRDINDFRKSGWNLLWFAYKVGDFGIWNLKRYENGVYNWEENLGISFPGYSTKMLLTGNVVTVENVGNITYGFLGKASGISDGILYWGSGTNDKKNHGKSQQDNESQDQYWISKGIQWYESVYGRKY